MNEISAFNPTGADAQLSDTMPHYIEAEQQLLGAILTNNDIYDRVASIIGPKHFYDPVHARIYEIAAARIAKNTLASPVTLKAFMEDDEGLKELGGPAYLARLAGAAISAFAARDYAQMIYDLLRAPRADRSSGAISPPRRPRSRWPTSPREQIVEAEQALYKLAEQGQAESGFQSFLKAVTDAVNVANAAYQRDGGLAGRLDRACRSGQEAGRLAPLGPADPCRAPLDGQDLAGHQHRLQHRQGLQARQAARRLRRRGQRRRGRASSRSR